jgi:hypothetical protein
MNKKTHDLKEELNGNEVDNDFLLFVCLGILRASTPRQSQERASMHAARVILAWVCGRWTTHFRVTEPSHGSLYVSPSLPFLPLASPFPLARPSRAVSRTHTLSLTLSTRRTWCFSASSDLNTSTTCHAIHVNIHTDTYIHIHNVCARASLCVLACVCIHPHTLSRSHHPCNREETR